MLALGLRAQLLPVHVLEVQFKATTDVHPCDKEKKRWEVLFQELARWDLLDHCEVEDAEGNGQQFVHQTRQLCALYHAAFVDGQQARFG